MTEPPPWTVGRWMTRDPICVAADEHLADALELMTNHRIRHLPVCDEQALVGILSSRDAHRAAQSPKPARVAEVMTKGTLHTVDTFQTVRAAAEVICREKISALPVVEGGTRVIGIITSEDLLWALLEGGGAE